MAGATEADRGGEGGGAQGERGGALGFLTPIEPARLDSSPNRELLERGAARKGYRMLWYRTDGGGLAGLRMIAYDRDGNEVQRMGVACLPDKFDEAEVAETVCELILEPVGG